MQRHVILILLFICTLSLHAQEVVMKNYRSEDGLPSNQTFHVMQDSKGYIWIGTDMGVSRFDGYEFENFDSSDGLPGNTILDIFEDYKGRIWFIALNAKLSYFYKDSIHQYKYNEKLISRLERSPVPLKRSFYVDSSDNVYISIRPVGIYRISSKGEVKSWLTWPEYKNFIFDFEDKSIITNYRKKADNIKVYKNDTLNRTYPLPKGFNPTRGLAYVNKIAEDNYYFSSTGSIFQLADEKTKSIYSNNKHFIIDFLVDQNNESWVCFAKGGTKHFTDLSFTNYDKHLLKDKSVSTVFKDRDEGFWFTTLENGVYYSSNMNVKTFASETFGKSTNIQAVRLINDKIYIVTKTQDLFKLQNIHNYQELTVEKEHINIMKTNYLYDLASFNNKFYLSTNFSLLHKNNTSDKYIEQEVVMHPTTRTTHGMKTLLFASNGDLYLGGASGFFRLLSQKGNTMLVDLVSKFRTSCFVLDNKEENLWIGSLYGLYQYNILEDSIYYHGNYSDQLKSRVLSLQISEENTIFIGTKGKGIIIYNPDTKQIETISIKDGLSSGFISSLLLNEDILWAGSNKGLNRINTIDKTIPIQHITKTYGIPSNHINDINLLDSTLLIATSKGLSFFYLNDIPQQHENLNILINHIQGSRLIRQDNKKYIIPYPYNTIGFNYTPLVYNHDKNLLYKYRIRGLSNKWQFTNQNEIFFPYLPFGNYTFEIGVKNNDGLWSDQLTKVDFEIGAPFWQRWWFIATTGILLLIIVLIVTYLTISNRRIKQEAKESIIRYQQQALSNQMNPHFLFNSLNSIHRYLLENNSIFASKYLSKFARLMRLFLNNSDEDLLTINKELETISLYLDLENMRMKNAFDFKVSIDKPINPDKMMIPNMILQPLVENAVIHGIRYIKNTRGLIEVAFSIENDLLKITVSDNGVGRDMALQMEHKNKRKAHGGNIVQKRIQLLNQLHQSNISIKYLDLYGKGAPLKGTKVIIDNIPINMSAYA